MNKEIHVLGLGPGIENYSNINDIASVGVNNIWDYYESEYVICIDKISAFSYDRFITIRDCKPVAFYTCWPEWTYVRKDYNLIELDNKQPGRGGLLDCLDSNLPVYPFHVDSTFTAVCLAYRLIKDIPGPGKIVMFGCRFLGHHQLQNFIPLIQDSYKRLYNALFAQGVTLYNADRQGALYDILPFYQ
jgi:hypothetical protein